MKKSNAAIMIICTLIIALFVYTASAKLLDYYNFHFGLTESPFIAPLADILAWAIPAIELLIAVLLVIPAFRLAGLYASGILMSLFTIYIAAMLLSGSDIPCSCGGVVEEMSWGAHIVFNSAFVVLSVWGIYLQRKKRRTLNQLTCFGIIIHLHCYNLLTEKGYVTSLRRNARKPIPYPVATNHRHLNTPDMQRDIIDRLSRLDHLIRIKGTGTPAQLAERLNLSERSIYDYINFMKGLGLPYQIRQLPRKLFL